MCCHFATLPTTYRDVVKCPSSASEEPAAAGFFREWHVNPSRLRHLVVLLVMLGHAAVWSTPCPPSSTRQSADAKLASASGLHASPAHQPGQHGAAHPAAQVNAADSDAGGVTLVATCPCGCTARPRAGGISLSPGWALVAPTIGLVRWSEAEPPRAGDPVFQPAPADPIDHVPILFS